MIISIDSSILIQFPQVKIGILIGYDVNNEFQVDDNISDFLRKAEQKVRDVFPKDVTQIAEISDWREAYRAFGCKPSEYRCSVEALLRRVIKGNSLPRINSIVDIYNLISVSYLLPAGGGDLDQIEGDIKLVKARGGEKFVMLKSSESKIIPAGEIVYCDDKDILCRAWNYRESDKTKITTDTKNIYLMLEGLQSTSKEKIKQALSALEKLLSTHCAGIYKSYILDSENPSITI